MKLEALHELESLGDSGLFQNLVGRVPGIDSDRHGKAMPIDRALPKFMTPLALPDQAAPVLQQNFTQGSVKAGTHASPRHVAMRYGRWHIKSQPHGIGIDGQMVQFDEFRSQFPNPISKRIEGLGFCYKMQVIADGGIETVGVSNAHDQRRIHRIQPLGDKAHHALQSHFTDIYIMADAWPLDKTLDTSGRPGRISLPEKNRHGIGVPEYRRMNRRPRNMAVFFRPLHGKPLYGQAVRGAVRLAGSCTRYANPRGLALPIGVGRARFKTLYRNIAMSQPIGASAPPSLVLRKFPEDILVVVKEAIRALNWFDYLFREIEERSAFEISDKTQTATLMLKLTDISKLSGMGKYLSTDMLDYIACECEEMENALEGETK